LVVEVVASAPDDPVQVVSKPRARIEIGGRYIYQVQASDANPHPPTLGLTGPAGMTNHSTRPGTRQPPPAPVRPPAPEIHVSDGRGSVGVENFTIEVTSQPQNRASVITSSAAPSAVAGRLYAYDLQVNDADHDPVSFVLVAAPRGMSIDA